jgi:hypothetical protein
VLPFDGRNVIVAAVARRSTMGACKIRPRLATCEGCHSAANGPRRAVGRSSEWCPQFSWGGTFACGSVPIRDSQRPDGRWASTVLAHRAVTFRVSALYSGPVVPRRVVAQFLAPTASSFNSRSVYLLGAWSASSAGFRGPGRLRAVRAESGAADGL